MNEQICCGCAETFVLGDVACTPCQLEEFRAHEAKVADMTKHLAAMAAAGKKLMEANGKVSRWLVHRANPSLEQRRKQYDKGQEASREMGLLLLSLDLVHPKTTAEPQSGDAAANQRN